ncbi:hypothetical protein O1L68_15045 [Streptomyces lydicus]|nr:hypothetical protein [Streptomyces lydicus]
MVDDAHHADTESLDLLGGVDLERVAPDVRLVLSVLRHRGRAAHARWWPEWRVERLANRRGAHRTVLPRLERAEVAAVVSRRLHAVADPELVCEAHDMSGECGGGRRPAHRVVPERRDPDGRRPGPAVSGHSAAGAAGRGPVRRDAARAGRAEPHGGRGAERSVAAGPGGRDTRGRGDRLVSGARGRRPGRPDRRGDRGELPGPEGAPPRGWAFSVPCWSTRSAAGWAPGTQPAVGRRGGSGPGRGGRAAGRDAGGRDAGAAAELLAEADPDTYLPDRLAEVDFGLDRRRVVAELAAAADRLHPDPGGGGCCGGCGPPSASPRSRRCGTT